MTPKEMLEATRRMIEEHAGGDPDKWFYANRFVFARLQQDERRTKTKIKRQLLDAGEPCKHCGNAFESRRGVHLHRGDSNRGYSRKNCVLMHGKCHREHHASDSGQHPGIIEKCSRRYEDGAFLYWWDISPGLRERLTDEDCVQLIKRDTRERCVVSGADLRRVLTQERQTTRGNGNWGLRVLRERPDELAVDAGRGGGERMFLPVVWLAADDD